MRRYLFLVDVRSGEADRAIEKLAGHLYEERSPKGITDLRFLLATKSSRRTCRMGQQVSIASIDRASHEAISQHATDNGQLTTDH